MRREIEAEGVELLLQPLHRRPVRTVLETQPGRLAATVDGEQVDLARVALGGGGAGVADDGLQALEQLGPVRMQRIEGSRPHPVFQQRSEEQPSERQTLWRIPYDASIL